MKSMFSWFRTIAFWEGVSYVVLLINMILIKNINPELGQFLVFPIGMAHGVLFVAYLIMTLMVKINYDRSFGWMLIAVLVSVVPFGTFIMEKKWKQEELAWNASSVK